MVKKRSKRTAAAKFGATGGKLAAAKMTPEQRSERARKAGLQRQAIRRQRELDEGSDSKPPSTPV